MQVKFYFCRHCHNLLITAKDSGVTPSCCNTQMDLLVPGTTDGASEKHVPVYSVAGNKVNVKVGEVAHPMTPEHSIGIIAVETEQGALYIKDLKPSDSPEAEFILNDGDKVKTVYEWCNLHGLWKV